MRENVNFWQNPIENLGLAEENLSAIDRNNPNKTAITLSR